MLPLSLFAQHAPANRAAEKPVPLYGGLGTWRHPIATKSAQAQKYFDQGLILMYSFNRHEAFRSFQMAAQLDPAAPMAYWGMASALGPYVNMDMDPEYRPKDSCAAAGKGSALPAITPNERAWLDASRARCPEFGDGSAYVRAMRDLAAAHKDDPDAQTLYAEALLIRTRWRWYERGEPAQGVAEAEHILEAVMRRFPYHPGANHLYIHAVESSPTPERAIPSAQRLMGIVPAAGHMVHMPGHIWLVLGDFDNAVAVNERAAEVDRQYFAAAGTDTSYYAYYLHNLSFLIYARSMQGRAAETNSAIQQMQRALQPVETSMPEMAAAFRFFITTGQIRTQQWDAILACPRPAAKDSVSLAFWHFARAMARAGKRDSEAAVTEQHQFEAERAKLDRNQQWDTNKLGPVVDLAAAVLSARLCNMPTDAVPRWRQAVALQEALLYDEPPAWFYPVRESLGAAMLRSGDAAGAEQIFREGLERSPHNGRLLFGLAQSLKAQNKTEAAAWVELELQAAWKGADLKLNSDDM